MDYLMSEILARLDAPKLKLAAAQSGPAAVPAVPGLYAFHSAVDIWRDLGLGAPPDGRPLYVGKSETSLAGRDVGTHFATGKTGSSTVRRTLAGLLACDLSLSGIPRNAEKPDGSANFALPPDCEMRLSDWMEGNLLLSVWPAVEHVVLKDLEKAVIRQLVPPLNLDHNSMSPWRREIRAARAVLAAQSRA